MSKTKKRSIIIVLLLIVAFSTAFVYSAIKNYNLYQEYLEEFDKIGYKNDDFPKDNILVSYETLNYMNNELYDFLGKDDDKIFLMDVIIDEFKLKPGIKFGKREDELLYKQKIINDYLSEINSDYRLDFLKYSSNEIFEQLQKKIVDKIDSIKIPDNEIFKNDKKRIEYFRKLKEENFSGFLWDSLLEYNEELNKIIKKVDDLNSKK